MYIDSNIFIFAAMDKTSLGDNCREVLEKIQKRDITCASSLLTIDEVIWVLKKKLGKEDAVRIARASLSLPVKWIEVDRSMIINMINRFNESNLDPRDSLHLSSMKASGIDTILSEDSNFDKVKGIYRMTVGELVERGM